MKPFGWKLFAAMVSATILGGIGGACVFATINGIWFPKANAEQLLGFAGGILGGLFTVAAAGVAWISIQPTIREAKKQSAAAARTAIHSVAQELEDEFDMVLELRNKIYEAQAFYLKAHKINHPVDTKQWVVDANDHRNHLEDGINKLVRLQVRYKQGDELREHRHHFIQWLELVRSHLDSILDAFERADRGAAPKLPPVDGAQRAIISTVRNMTAFLNKYDGLLQVKLTVIWERLRDLEAKAL